MRPRRLRTFCMLLLAVALAILPGAPVAPVHAETTGFAGRVYHLVTQEPIAGASITVGEVQVFSDDQGWYVLPLPPGRYTVTARAAGYIGMSHDLQRVSDYLSSVDFAMIPEEPTEEMSARIVEQLDLVEQTLPLELALQAQAGEITPSGVTALPATIRVAVRQDPAVLDSPIVEIITLDFEDYIKGVVPYEMSPGYPLEALKAQAVAARSYAAANLGKHAAEGADVCSSVHCQVWRPTHYETTDRAVDATRGIAATYGGSIIYAFYHGHCDGHTRNSEDVWSAALPYCRAVACTCGYTERLGHGVGMCQEGARAMANAGATFDQIITHYYTGVSLLGGPSSSLSEARADPVTGTEADLFVFRIRYRSDTGLPPPIANVIIDGAAHAMVRESGTPGEGWTYAYETWLAAGTHTYSFEFDDGYGRLLKAPSGGSYALPQVGAVTPPPTHPGVLQGNITNSTAADWAGGQLDGIQIASVDKDVLALAVGRTSGTYTSPVLTAAAPFVAYGLSWYVELPDGSSVTVQTRSSLDNVTWSPWHTEEGEAYYPDNARLLSAELVFGEAQHLQYRVTMVASPNGSSPALRNIRASFTDSRPGPQASSFAEPEFGAASVPSIITRAQWGANEGWMTWAPEYRDVSALIMHHTVTDDGGIDPAAIVRAIYWYHAVERGWGDIGYNYLIDHAGRIYEGRTGGQGAIGHHAGDPYNYGSAGISLIGNYEDNPVPAAMYNSVTSFLAYECGYWGLNPVGDTYLIDRWVPTILGHRDVAATACPGAQFYSLLPSVRYDTLAKLTPAAPTIALTTPATGQQVRGVLEPQYTATGVVTDMAYYVDGTQVAWQPTLFSWKWNTTLWPDGPHTVRVVVQNAGGSAESSVNVTVDNTPPAGSASAPAWTSATQIPVTISGEASGVAFSEGWTWEGESLYHQTGILATDAGASQGASWLGRGGEDRPGAWYGPYTCILAPGAYQAVFRLRTDNTASSAGLATIDVADGTEGISYALQPVHADGFANTQYQDMTLPFGYGSPAPSCQSGNGGLEFRTWYSGAGNLWLDRVSVYTAPVARADVHLWPAPSADGVIGLTVRLLDVAGNAKDEQLTVGVDRTAPIWPQSARSGYWVRDLLAGLDTSRAAWQHSSDGGRTWGNWQALPSTAPSGTRENVLLYTGIPTGGLVRYRIYDLAGNEGISAAVEAGLGLPELNERVYLPSVLR